MQAQRKGLPMELLQGSQDPKELELQLRAGLTSPLVKRLKELVERRIKRLETYTPGDFTSPNWGALEAFRQGNVAAYKTILELISFDQERNVN